MRKEFLLSFKVIISLSLNFKHIHVDIISTSSAGGTVSSVSQGIQAPDFSWTCTTGGCSNCTSALGCAQCSPGFYKFPFRIGATAINVCLKCENLGCAHTARMQAATSLKFGPAPAMILWAVLHAPGDRYTPTEIWTTSMAFHVALAAP